MLKNLIVMGGSAMIVREIADLVQQARIDREKALRRKKAGILMLGVTIGSTAGVIAGVLFAPRAGKETREDLSRRGGEAWVKIKENASDTGQRIVRAVEEKSSRIRMAAEKNVDAAKEVLEEPPK